MTSVLPRRVRAKGSTQCTSWSMEYVDLALRDRIDSDRRGPHHRRADHSEAHQELLVEVVIEIAPLLAEAQHRHRLGIEDGTGAGLVAGLEAVPGLHEDLGLVAERHGAAGAAAHLLDEVAAAGAAEDCQRAAYPR